MSITITDPKLLAQLASVSGTIELRDEAGTLVGQLAEIIKRLEGGQESGERR